MRISAKGRYGLAAMIELARFSTEDHHIPVVMLADRLGLSKIYLEQVFSLLKRGKLVISIKGAQGGYRLSRPASEINVCQILSALEQILFEPTEQSVADSAPAVEEVMATHVYAILDQDIQKSLSKITLDQLVKATNSIENRDNYMFFI
ncbi:MAG: Rrf2 family transcriptional regulator [Eubacteriaceae bacterium]|nr:Rrf2 family transcriptional regulator [Eubacteriaceae bacterium]